MKVFPLESISLEEAVQKQFKLVDCITREFKGSEFLTLGDLGVVQPGNEPKTTRHAEKVIANFFNQPDAILVRGSGTAAIREALHAALKTGEKLLVHEAPVYPTTQNSIDLMGLTTVTADYNQTIEKSDIQEVQAALVQFTRQQPKDSYDMGTVIERIHTVKPDLPIVTDDNYAVLKVKKIGVELGADLSCFSTFKLLGPEGIGCIVGEQQYIERIRKEHYSGGSQVQGHEALAVLRGLVYAPVALANQAKVIQQTLDILNSGNIPEIKTAYVANAQSKVLLVEFKEPIAKEILQQTDNLGAAPNPVGAESKYEVIPMFYRLSSTFRQYDPSLSATTIRINPNRSGSQTIIRILKEAIAKI